MSPNRSIVGWMRLLWLVFLGTVALGCVDRADRAVAGGDELSSSRSSAEPLKSSSSDVVLDRQRTAFRGLSKRPKRRAVAPAVRVDRETQEVIDHLVEQAIKKHRLPGAVIAFGRADGPIFQRAYGSRWVKPKVESMSNDTLFDLASLTKPVATATAVMLLVEEGKVALDDPVGKYLDAFSKGKKGNVRVQDLLRHAGGVPRILPLEVFEQPREAAIESVLDAPLETLPGKKVNYSDLGFISLGALVEKVSGMSLDTFAKKRIFAPLRMNDSSFGVEEDDLARTAPTEMTDKRGKKPLWIHGEVHDPRAYRLGGVAGNAGVFSTAADLTRFARMMLGKGVLDGRRLLKEETVEKMLSSISIAGQRRALGWDVRSSYSQPRPSKFSDAAYGHSGFTGTSLWIDPKKDLFVLVLSNRVHPHGRGDIRGLARILGDVAVDCLEHVREGGKRDVMLGVDVLREEGFSSLEGAHLGLITNASGLSRDGLSTRRVLHEAPNVDLIRIFSPEHGLSGQKEGAQSNVVDRETGLPVVSLFGRHRVPTAKQLKGLDTLAIDLQDVGVRFYTYGSTMRLAMDAAKKHDLRFVVLDRPNPLGGYKVTGPVDKGPRTFVNDHPMPVLHGMTLGELARFLNEDAGIGVNLDVVALEGWKRQFRFDQLNLSWVAPSPNLPTIHQVSLYPAVGLVEGTNLSVGRGTDSPFEMIGAPWLVPKRVIVELEAQGLEGVAVEPASFVPRTSAYRKELCRGIRLRVIDSKKYRPMELALALARSLVRTHPQWRLKKMLPMLGDHKILAEIQGDRPIGEIAKMWSPELAAFKKKRKKYLLY